MRNATLMTQEKKVQIPYTPTSYPLNKLECRGLQVCMFRKTLHRTYTLPRVGNSASVLKNTNAVWKNTASVWKNTASVWKNTASVWKASSHYEPRAGFSVGLVQDLLPCIHLSFVCKSVCYPPLV